MAFVFPSGLGSRHICVIGDIMLDHYIYGTCDRISPEAPVPVVDIKKEVYTLGGAGNVLENLNAFGCRTSLISVSGDDEVSQIVIRELDQLQSDFYYLAKDPTRRTTVKTRVVASKHQLIRLDSEDKHPIDSEVEKGVLACLNEHISQIDAVILSDYRKGVLTNTLIKAIIDLCKQYQVLTIIDSKIKDLSVYYGADLIKPNKKEASLATDIQIVDEATLLQACKKIAEITACKYVVVTLSEDGIAAFCNDKLIEMPTRSLDVFDVTGAGDTVVSALALGLVNDLSIEQSCDLANHAAAIVVGKVGSATATIEEINRNFSKYPA